MAIEQEVTRLQRQNRHLKIAIVMMIVAAYFAISTTGGDRNRWHDRARMERARYTIVAEKYIELRDQKSKKNPFDVIAD